MAEIDVNKAQAWFIRVSWDDIYHGTLMVIQDTLPNCLKKLHSFCELTGCLAEVYHLSGASIGPDKDPLWLQLQQLGMLLRRVANVQRDYDFDRWKASFSRTLGKLPLEQRLAELQLLQGRVAKELESTKVIQQLQPAKAEPVKEIKCTEANTNSTS